MEDERADFEEVLGPPKVDLAAIAARYSLSDADFAFAKAVLAGSKMTEAARLAGFPQEGGALRQKASELAKTRRIKGFLTDARSAGLDPQPDEPLDNDQRRRLLSRIAKSKDNGAVLRALEIDAKLADLDEAEGAVHNVQPADVLNMIADISPMHAAALAHRHGCPIPELSIEAIRKMHCPACAQRLIEKLGIAPTVATNGNISMFPGVEQGGQ